MTLIARYYRVDHKTGFYCTDLMYIIIYHYVQNIIHTAVYIMAPTKKGRTYKCSLHFTDKILTAFYTSKDCKVPICIDISGKPDIPLYTFFVVLCSRRPY